MSCTRLGLTTENIVLYNDSETQDNNTSMITINIVVFIIKHVIAMYYGGF